MASGVAVSRRSSGSTVIVAILAKGGSRRLGGAVKPLLLFQGKALIERPLAVATACGLRALVVTNSQEIVRYFRGRAEVTVLTDALDDSGPVGALFTALSCNRQHSILLLGCDMPWLSPEVIQTILRAAGRAPATVPCINGVPQPLCAVYEPAALPVITTALSKKSIGLAALCERMGAQYLDEAALGYTADCRWFHDVDSWEDYAALTIAQKDARH